MGYSELWKYCTPKDCREMILSLRLLEGMDWEDEKVIACLYSISNHPERHYSPILIPKKDGAKRRLMAPDPLLKIIQKNILRHILDGREVSPHAYAYKKKVAALDNAAPHVGKDVILKLDIKDFFGSVSFTAAAANAFPSRYFPPAVQMLLTSLCFCNEELPQGAPTSPSISNLVMRPFDDYMGEWCEKRCVTYTRYSDDMIFSGNFNPNLVRRKAENFLNAMGFELNEMKTKVALQGGRQSVTGIVVNEKPQLARDYRRKLRQEIYFCEKLGVRVHLENMGKKKYLGRGEEGNEKYLQSLLGKVNYILCVNPQDMWFQAARTRLQHRLHGVAACDER